MVDKYVLSIDCRTQSIRALIFDKDGTLIGKRKREFEPYFSNYNNAEIYALLYKKVYMKIYPSLKNLYKDIKEITGYPKY